MTRAPARLAELEARLQEAFSTPLPGSSAQQLLAPVPRPGSRFPAPSDPKNASGLLLVYPGADGPAVVLTVRAGNLEHHRGQISLPGGAWNAGETPEAAALREAEEEIGIDPTAVRLLGRLTPLFIPVSGYTLHPVVGASDARPLLRAADGEVARILEVPIGRLFDPVRLRRERRARAGIFVDVPFFDLDGDELWGATAMVMAEFLTMLGWRPPARRLGVRSCLLPPSPDRQEARPDPKARPDPTGGLRADSTDRLPRAPRRAGRCPRGPRRP